MTTPQTPPVHEAAHRRDWPAYFDRMEGKPARDTLLKALALFGDIDPNNPPLAIDLGCGAGRDSVAMLSAGWNVWAQDGSDDGLNRTKSRPEIKSALNSNRIQIHHADFENLQIPKTKLLNASFSLPFCPPTHFKALWQQIDHAIEPGGRFSGQLFGDRDDWATIDDRSHFTRTETLALFDQYILESFTEEDRPSKHIGENHKHWHVFHIVARKKESK
ncbi:MAG: class I SAM-dependent methyltransferase [Phycisphaerales bacterium]|nr:class I SAM-dependent methyltransferase [Phycisphaerales bacterium]